MIRLLRFLWSGCFHHWETIRVVRYEYSRDSPGEIRSGNCDQFTLRCTKCGAMKTFINK